MDEVLARVIEGILILSCGALATLLSRLSREVGNLSTMLEERTRQWSEHYYTKQETDERISKSRHFLRGELQQTISELEVHMHDHLVDKED